MVIEDDASGSPKISGNPSRKRREVVENGEKNENLFSPRFRSVAAMAGWDEEALLIASLIVEDTPDRQCKQRKRLDLHNAKSPPTNSRRKRMPQKGRSTAPIPVTILDLDEDEPKSKQESTKTIKEDNKSIVEVKKKQRVEVEDEELNSKKSSDVSSSTPLIPCLDRLREELSCAVCLEICYEPSTTPCGHSFCKKCLSSAADKCGRKCPKCRQIISNGKYCKVNTVLWNTIQLLFPIEVKARKAAAAAAAESQEAQSKATREAQLREKRRATRSHISQLHQEITQFTDGLERRRIHEQRYRRLRPAPRVLPREELVSQQDRDAEIALRLQREEFSEAFLGPDIDEHRSSLTSATANLRATASRAINIRIGRGQRG